MAGGLFNLGMQSVKTFGAKNTLKGASAANKAINAGNKLGHVGVGTATGAVAGAAGDKFVTTAGAASLILKRLRSDHSPVTSQLVLALTCQ